MKKTIELDGARDLWNKTGDPRWVWRAIRDRIHHHEPFPDWVIDYLGKCADGIESATGDIARGLHGILGFSSKSGRKRDVGIDLLNERFAMSFAAGISRGESIFKARRAAAKTWDLLGRDDKDRRRMLREFFELKTLPRTAVEWKAIIVRWGQLHPGYADRYPDLQLPVDFGLPHRG
jgi:hypothetical protein